MLRLTKLTLKRPVTALLVILSLVFFGGMSVLNSKLELTPDINMPMLFVMTSYVGASPEDIDELVSRPLEEGLSSLSDLDSIRTRSNENYGLVLLQYEYGTDMDNAYSDLRKTLDNVKNDLPEDAGEPVIIEMSMDSMGSMYIAVNNASVVNIYNYAETEILPELEKLSSVGSVEISGGNEEYIKVELDPERMSLYGLDISTVASLVGAASFTIPAGSAYLGDVDMSISMRVSYDTPESLSRIPITLGNGNIIYLEDIATVSRAQKKNENIGRYNGEDTIILAISRNTQYTDVDLSRQVKAALEEMHAANENLDFIVGYDSADEILEAIHSMLETMAVVVAVSAVILFIFYGDLKASLIVGTSIPISIFAAFCMIWGMGYTYNIITLGGLILAIGMMVDNSIVVLESCFRVKEENPGEDFRDYLRSAVYGTEQVAASVFGGTLTTCVVFLPLAFISGLSGQLFQPLGLTMVFCLAAALLSSCSIVPLCYVFYRPVEQEKAPAYGVIRRMQRGYRLVMAVIMHRKKTALLITALLLILSVVAAVTGIDASLMPETDEGMITIEVDMRSNLSTDAQDETLRKIEKVIAEDEDVESYLLSASMSFSSGTSSTLTVYLKDDRLMSTDDHVIKWKNELQSIDNCDIEVAAYSEMSMLSEGGEFSISLASADYDELREVSDEIYKALQQDRRVTAVTSSLANTSPIIEINVDTVQATAEGLVPASVASSVYTMLSGVEADTMDVDSVSESIMVEYPEDEYDDINKVKDIQLGSSTGKKVYLRDIAEVSIADSPTSIVRENKQYTVDITAAYTDLADQNTEAELRSTYIDPYLMTADVEEVDSWILELMNDEFSSLYNAIAIAVFLVFVVMAAQFESPRFSLMVMACIPFAMIGALGFLWILDIDISMVSILGFLMLIGTVVNNGILYVDTVDQKRRVMGLEEAIVESGVIRLRPILMTTLTTVFGMVPMALSTGGSSEIMQSLAWVSIGGFISSTILALLILPVLYYYVNGNRERRRSELEEL